jgi:hypothetical protein
LQDKFAVVVARALWFPQILGCGVGVFSKVGARIGVGACGMNGTDEVWVAGVEQTARAFREFGHGGGLRFMPSFRYFALILILIIQNVHALSF